MLETLKAWLNGTRDYNTGASIYNLLGTDEKLKALFAEGHSLYNNYRLQEELKTICKNLKKEKNGSAKISKTAKATIKEIKPTEEKADELDTMLSAIADTAAAIAKHISPPNPELLKASKVEADKAYKEAMNKRAVLFAMLPTDKYSNHNSQDLVEARRKLCLEVVAGYNHASELYDQADHVKLFGKLPDQKDPGIEDEVAKLEDFQVKEALNNARKARNKLKDKEQTSDRVVLMQNHDLRIKKLEERWLCLKPRK